MIAVNNSFKLVVQENPFNFVKAFALSLVLERSIRQQRTKYGEKHLKGSGNLKTDISPKMCCYDHYLQHYLYTYHMWESKFLEEVF